MSASGEVAIFGPHPMLSITVEALTAEGGDDIHLHAAGQGVWVARMAAEFGAEAVLCGFFGGETGSVLRPLLEQLAVELRLVETAEATGAYIHDRRSGERVPLAQSAAMPPSRHEVDDLFSVACAAALECGTLAVCNPFPGEALPLDLYGSLVADARANGACVLVDLSSPRLDSALEGKPDLVKINDWELAAFVAGPVDTEARMRAAMERLLAAGAGAAIVTRAEQPELALRGDEAWTLASPRFERGSREGCGDSMMGALAACCRGSTRGGAAAARPRQGARRPPPASPGRPPAAAGQVLDPAQEALAQRPGRRLQQHPTAAAQRHPPQIVLAQPVDRRLGDLASGQHRDRDSLAAQVAVERLHPPRHLVDADVVIVADVRRRADRLDPVGGCLAGEAGAVADVERPVVDAGEDVAVQVDHAQNLVQRSPPGGTGLR